MEFIYRLKDIAGFDANTTEELKDKLTEYFTIEGSKPDVIIEGTSLLSEWMIKKYKKQKRSSLR